MNAFLKACIDEAFDLEKVGEELVAKQYATAVGNVVKAVTDAGPIVQNLNDAKPELEALLKDPSSDADVLAYIASKAAASVENPKIADVVSAAADLGLSAIPVVEKALVLKDKIVALKAV